MKKHYALLYIEDDIMHWHLLRQLLPEYTIYWLPSTKQLVKHGVKLFPSVDMIVCDIGGTSQNAIEDMKKIKHNRILMTSVLPYENLPFEFVDKEDLSTYIRSRLRG